MDAVEYEKGRRRMCRTNILKKGSCEGCDAYSVLMHRCDFVPPPPGRKADDEKVIKKNIATVEQWVKDNQIKTRQSEFLKMFPNKEQKRYIDRPMRLIVAAPGAMLIGALLIYLFALCCKQISGLWREQK